MQSIIDSRQPLALLAGAVGSGKSMVVATVADHCTEQSLPIILHLNACTAADALTGILVELHHAKTLDVDTSQRPTDRIELLKKQLARRYEAGQHVVAFFDPTNDMPDDELANLLKIIGSLGDPAPLTTFVIGPTELLIKTHRIAQRGGRSFPETILGPMAPADTALYIRHRMLRAGGDPAIFSDAAIELIHDLCGGLPRRVNRLCDLCLLVGYSRNCDPITHNLVWTAQGEIRVLTPSRTPLAAPTRRWRPLGKRLRVSGEM